MKDNTTKFSISSIVVNAQNNTLIVTNKNTSSGMHIVELSLKNGKVVGGSSKYPAVDKKSGVFCATLLKNTDGKNNTSLI